MPHRQLTFNPDGTYVISVKGQSSESFTSYWAEEGVAECRKGQVYWNLRGDMMGSPSATLP